MKKDLRGFVKRLSAVVAVTVGCLSLWPMPAYGADAPSAGFSLQVSPSPLVATVKPGQHTSLDMQIRNTSSAPQTLKMGLRSFTVGETSGEVKLGDKPPADGAGFTTFSNPTFALDAGQIFTQHISLAIPKNAGFTYSFAITISQQNPPQAQAGTSSVRGSVAVFTLLSVDRPGAVRRVDLQEFSVSKHVYEYLPTSLSVKLKNTGNTLAQPTGNIFIQRGDDDKSPIATISINQAGGYIIPGSTRVLTNTWSDGFPHYDTVTEPDGRTGRKLSWSGGDFTKLRFGRYTAKLVAVFNDGTHDIPLQASVTFWVIPWRLILVTLVIIAILCTGLFTIFKRSSKAIRHPKRKHEEAPKT